MKKFDIISIGEFLIDYSQTNSYSNKKIILEQNAGGAPANVVVCGAKLGLKTSIITKVGNDFAGNFLKNTLLHENVDTSGIILDHNYNTTLAFVSVSDDGERNFSFFRKNSADIMLNKHEIDINMLKNTKIFHFGSVSLTNSPSKEATLFAVKYAKEQGAIISFDPNYREMLWENEQIAKNEIQNALKYVDILKISDEEIHLISDKADIDAALKSLNIPIIVLTLGKNGSKVYKNGEFMHIAGFKPQKIGDTNGAGDCFTGSFLYNISKCDKTDIDINELAKFAKFSNAAASLCVENFGAISSLPTLDEINVRLK